MASTNFTTHYSIPLPLGTDLTTPMDYNEAAEAVDTALFGAVTDAGNASIAAGNAVDTANAASDAVDTVAADLVQEKAKIVALQTRVTNAENEIDDVRADASDMITAYNEPTATSTHAYAIGDYFIYNNTLYKATAAIAIGATIVPDTNCETTNVSSELVEIKSDLSNVGKVVYGQSGEAVSTANNDFEDLMSTNIPPSATPKLYMIRMRINCSSNSTGMRILRLKVQGGSETPITEVLQSANAVNGTGTILSGIWFVTADSTLTKTVTVQSFQNSGAALSVTPDMSIIELS